MALAVAESKQASHPARWVRTDPERAGRLAHQLHLPQALRAVWIAQKLRVGLVQGNDAAAVVIVAHSVSPVTSARFRARATEDLLTPNAAAIWAWDWPARRNLIAAAVRSGVMTVGRPPTRP